MSTSWGYLLLVVTGKTTKLDTVSHIFMGLIGEMIGLGSGYLIYSGKHSLSVLSTGHKLEPQLN